MGLRKYKYRVIARPLNDRIAQEEALNKFAAFGYRLVNRQSVRAFRAGESKVLFTLRRRTRKPAVAATPEAGTAVAG